MSRDNSFPAGDGMKRKFTDQYENFSRKAKRFKRSSLAKVASDSALVDPEGDLEKQLLSEEGAQQTPANAATAILTAKAEKLKEAIYQAPGGHLTKQLNLLKPLNLDNPVGVAQYIKTNKLDTAQQNQLHQLMVINKRLANNALSLKDEDLSGYRGPIQKHFRDELSWGDLHCSGAVEALNYVNELDAAADNQQQERDQAATEIQARQTALQAIHTENRQRMLQHFAALSDELKPETLKNAASPNDDDKVRFMQALHYQGTQMRQATTQAQLANPFKSRLPKKNADRVDEQRLTGAANALYENEHFDQATNNHAAQCHGTLRNDLKHRDWQRNFNSMMDADVAYRQEQRTLEAHQPPRWVSKKTSASAKRAAKIVAAVTGDDNEVGLKLGGSSTENPHDKWAQLRQTDTKLASMLDSVDRDLQHVKNMEKGLAANPDDAVLQAAFNLRETALRKNVNELNAYVKMYSNPLFSRRLPADPTQLNAKLKSLTQALKPDQSAASIAPQTITKNGQSSYTTWVPKPGGGVQRVDGILTDDGVDLSGISDDGFATAIRQYNEDYFKQHGKLGVQTTGLSAASKFFKNLFVNTYVGSGEHYVFKSEMEKKRFVNQYLKPVYEQENKKEDDKEMKAKVSDHQPSAPEMGLF